jgi:hypothetical protein
VGRGIITNVKNLKGRDKASRSSLCKLLLSMANDWTREEVELIVSEYFEMLTKEQSGIPYNKSEVRSRILPLLSNRTKGSIEFKNQNISAILVKIGQPYIRGYAPLFNYQSLLEEVVFAHIRLRPEIVTTFKVFAETVPTPTKLVFQDMVEEVPTREVLAQEPELIYNSPVKINYIELEQANRAVGKTGESVALEFEKWRLINSGHESLVDKIEWVSQTQGDGLGFDILSHNPNGTDRYIEVKATKLTKEAPFYFSSREYTFAKQNGPSFFLYRVFNLTTVPKLFIASGSYDEFCNIRPTNFKGSF